MLKILLILSIATSFALLRNVDGFEIKPRIFNGFTAARDQFPFFAFFRSTVKEGIKSCGATILSDSWLLTAAHCLVGLENVTVYLGSKYFQDQTKEETEFIQSDGFYVHPHFNQTYLKNDMALLRFNRPIKFNSSIQPVKLSNDPKLKKGEIVFAIGYGTTGIDGNLASELQWTPLKIRAKQQCLDIFPFLETRNYDLCVGSDSLRSVCLGDSGGPLIRKSDKSLVAVSSFIHKNGCTYGYPQVFSNLFKFSGWITTITGLNIHDCR